MATKTKKRAVKKATNGKAAHDIAAASPSKADSIRAAVKANPAARVIDIIHGLAARGIEVSSAQVSTTRRDILGSKKAAPAGGVTLADLHAARDLVQRLGGADKAEAVLKEYNELFAKATLA